MKWLSFLLAAFLFVFCDKNPANNDVKPGTLTDIEGNVYKTVRVGNQEWMAENLRVTRYNDGTAIPQVPDSAQWVNLTTPGYCYYNNATHADTIKKWGALYNWHVVSPTNPKQIARAGWRVPDTTDWNILESYLITNGYNWDGTTTGNKIAKSMAAKADWSSYTTAGTIGNDISKNNASGFSALPGGCRYYYGDFNNQGTNGLWWSATEYEASYAYNRGLTYCDEYQYRGSIYKSCGFSLRLVRDHSNACLN